MNLRMNNGKDVSDTPKKSMRTNWLVVFISIAVLIVGGFFIVSRIVFLLGTLSADGTIVSCQYDQSDDGETCQPTVSFVAQSGQKITFVEPSSSDSYQKGDTLQVRYHPGTPQDASVDDFWAWIPFLFGVVLILMSLFFGLALSRQGQFSNWLEEVAGQNGFDGVYDTNDGSFDGSHHHSGGGFGGGHHSGGDFGGGGYSGGHH